MATILIIDDNADDRESYIRALRKMEEKEDTDYRTLEAIDGKSGLAVLKDEPVDCVLLDYSLPGMDGLEVLKTIRMQDTFLPIILLTGQGNETLAVEAIKKGAHDYLAKSGLKPERLHQTIQSAINQGRLRRDIIERDSQIRTQSKELEKYVAELEEAKKQQDELIAKLVESNSELERFAYICSHDLQEPLRVISNYTQRLELHLGKRLDVRGRHYMLYITDGAAHARRLIRDVLDYARIDQEARRLEQISGDEVMWNVLRDLSEQVEDTGATVTHDPLPWVNIEPTHLRQLLQNLISNALKFTTDMPKVHVSAKQEGNFWRFSVQDNGIGIAWEHQERIFNIFQRLNERETYPGSGIGLASCKKLVEKYGGTISVESAPGKGSTFSFTLPMIGTKKHEVA